jgi:hypothetical protein
VKKPFPAVVMAFAIAPDVPEQVNDPPAFILIAPAPANAPAVNDKIPALVTVFPNEHDVPPQVNWVDAPIDIVEPNVAEPPVI